MTTIPPPEIPARPIDDGQLRTSAKRLFDKADKSDHWTAEATCSRGPVVTSAGWWSGRHADCIVIRLSRDDAAEAIAIFLNGRFVSGLTWSWCTTCTSEGFKHPVRPPVEAGYRELCGLVSKSRKVPPTATNEEKTDE